MKGKVLITDDVHPLLAEGLELDGYEVDNRPNISAEEVLQIISGYTGLIINSKVYAGKELLERAVRLKFVCRTGSGLEVIDLKTAQQKNIVAINSPEGNSNAVAEHALALLLNVMNHISKADAELRHYQWLREANRGNELSGKTVGLIAFGHNARAFAKLLGGFDVNILAYDKYVHGFGTNSVKEATLEQIAEEADVLSLHLPLTAETEYMVDYRFLASFTKPIWLLNISRGKVLRTADMLRCIDEGKIKAAALDVLENEKLSTLSTEEKKMFDRLINDRRILLTPHIAGWTVESKQKIAEVLLQKIRAIQ